MKDEIVRTPFQTENEGLRNLVEVLDFVFDGEEAIKKAKSDGKVNFMDWPTFIGLIPEAETAYEGLATILPGYKNASIEERATVVDHFKQRFDLENDRIEFKVEKTIEGIACFVDAAVA